MAGMAMDGSQDRWLKWEFCLLSNWCCPKDKYADWDFMFSVTMTSVVFPLPTVNGLFTCHFVNSEKRAASIRLALVKVAFTFYSFFVVVAYEATVTVWKAGTLVYCSGVQTLMVVEICPQHIFNGYYFHLFTFSQCCGVAEVERFFRHSFVCLLDVLLLVCENSVGFVKQGWIFRV